MSGQGVFDSLVAGDTNLGETQDGFRYGAAAIGAIKAGAVSPWYPAGLPAFGLGTTIIAGAGQNFWVPFVSGRNAIVTAMGVILGAADGGGATDGFFAIYADAGLTPVGGAYLGGNALTGSNFNQVAGTVVTAVVDAGQVILPPGLNWACVGTKHPASTLQLEGFPASVCPPLFGFSAPAGNAQTHIKNYTFLGGDPTKGIDPTVAATLGTGGGVPGIYFQFA